MMVSYRSRAMPDLLAPRAREDVMDVDGLIEVARLIVALPGEEIPRLFVHQKGMYSLVGRGQA